MFTRIALATMLAVSTLATLPGCAVSRGQESVGAYIDDSTITTAVKARFVDAKSVDAASISVETMQGTVLLTGFAKNERERVDAEALAREVKGVKSVSNRIIVRN